MSCQNNHEEITIERCPHDSENPYTMVLNELIRSIKISPTCIALIILLLSNKQGWKIKISQIIEHYKTHMGRDKVYKLIDEAINAGFIKRETYLDKGKLRYKYFVSEKPKFNPTDSFKQFPENQDTEIQYTENTDSKEGTCSKKEHIKEGILKPPPPTSSKKDGGGGNENISSGIIYKNGLGKVFSAQESDIYLHFLKFPYPTSIVKESIEELKKNTAPINNLMKFLEAICFRLSQIPQAKHVKEYFKEELNPYCDILTREEIDKKIKDKMRNG